MLAVGKLLEKLKGVRGGGGEGGGRRKINDLVNLLYSLWVHGKIMVNRRRRRRHGVLVPASGGSSLAYTTVS